MKTQRQRLSQLKHRGLAFSIICILSLANVIKIKKLSAAIHLTALKISFERAVSDRNKIKGCVDDRTTECADNNAVYRIQRSDRSN